MKVSVHFSPIEALNCHMDKDTDNVIGPYGQLSTADMRLCPFKDSIDSEEEELTLAMDHFTRERDMLTQCICYSRRVNEPADFSKEFPLSSESCMRVKESQVSRREENQNLPIHSFKGLEAFLVVLNLFIFLVVLVRRIDHKVKH